GGKDNFAVDREASERSTRAVPQLPWFARENRKFLGRVVRFCAEAGVTQFLDIGSGLPTMENVHQVAERITANPHVVYVDNDPVVVSHARALLATPHTAAIIGDVSRPEDILRDRELQNLIDFSKPVAILLLAILHFVPDELDPAQSVATLRDILVPGSFLAVSHIEFRPGQVEGSTPLSEAAKELGEARKKMPPTAPFRDRDRIAGFFGDFTLLEPGLVDVWGWRPDEETVNNSSDVMTLTGGLARKDG
ncbi:MAG TPA: SAM-dependent methyltransferase, partial [Streptosporangiaceae bacterium]|nr:SAM-dependent methyltransferase [Streptosporangiaceae bacterium]